MNWLTETSSGVAGAAGGDLYRLLLFVAAFVLIAVVADLQVDLAQALDAELVDEVDEVTDLSHSGANLGLELLQQTADVLVGVR